MTTSVTTSEKDALGVTMQPLAASEIIPPKGPVSYRSNQILSLIFLPLLTGIGHCAPSVGAARAMMGWWFLDWPVIIATSTITAFIDAYDKYRDIPKPDRPSQFSTLSYLIPLLGTTFVSSAMMGPYMAFRLHRWLIFGFVYGNPLIPVYSFKTGKFRFVKPKVVFAVAKSASVALVMANVDGDIGALNACRTFDGECRLNNLGAGTEIYWRSFALAFIYNWVRETMCDVRDLIEDANEGIPTLPVTVGPWNAVGLITLGTFLTEQYIFSGLMQGDILAFPGWDSVVRQVITLLGCFTVFNKPREDKLTWSLVAFVGLLPATWAQSRL